MIRFYYRAGSSATSLALTETIRGLVRAGKKVLLLVPEQETVSVERRMLRELPPTAQLTFEVVNFSRLANRVFRTLGGHRWHIATPPVRALLMWRTLRELSPLLLRYGAHATEPKLCDMMLDTATRTRAYRIPASDLLQTAELLEKGEPLRDKLIDIGTVIGTFERALAERFDNGDDELDRLSEILQNEGKELFCDTHVFIDSFTDFTAQEREILRALMATVPMLGITLPLSGPHDEGLHLESAVRTQKELRHIAAELSLEVEIWRAPEERPTTAHEYLARHLFDMDAEPAPLSLLEQEDVTLTVASTPFAEAQAAVAEIQRLIRNGCRYRDIAIVLRDANASVGILDAALEREGIPFFLAEKTDITVRPLVKLLLLALRIHLYHWRTEDVVAYLKTGLCGVSTDDINRLEEYASVWQPRGEHAFASPFSRNPDGYNTKITARGESILAGANRAREALFPPLQALFSALDAAKGATDMCRALYDFLSALGVREQMKSTAERLLAAGERREAEELSRLYAVTVEALESVANTLCDEPLTLPLLQEALKIVFARTDIGVIPTSADEVTVGSASMLRADHPRYVLVLGLNEGYFPRPVTDEGLISQGELERLSELDLRLPSGKAERSSDELFYLYRAFCAPRDGLLLFYTKSSSDGHALSPSIAVERTRALLKEIPLRVFEATDPLSLIFSPAAALDRIADLEPTVRAQVAAFLRKWGVSAADSLSLPVTQRDASVPVQTAATLFDRARFSPTHLESYASCPFAYYCDKILRLREEKDGTFGLLDIGTFVHFVLEHTLARVKEHQKAFSAWSEAERDALVAELCQSHRALLLQSGTELTPRSSALLDRLAALIRLVVTSLFAEFADSDFTPALLEFDLRDTGVTPSLSLADGNRIPLSGKADRLDIWHAPDGRVFCRVVDYKTGTRRFDVSDIAKGVSLQMPLYLKALCSAPHPVLNRTLGLPEDTVLTPAGVTYFSSAISSETTPAKKGEFEALCDAASRLSRSGVLLDDPDVLQAASHSADPSIIGGPRSKQTLSDQGFCEMFDELENTVSRLCTDMKGGRAAARPNRQSNRLACEYCRFAAICRISPKERKGGS